MQRLIDMLQDLIKRAEKDGANLAPFIGIGCPGVIRADGSIERGGQNLPGDWEHKSFNLPARSCAKPFPRSAITRRWSSCITTRWCRA